MVGVFPGVVAVWFGVGIVGGVSILVGVGILGGAGVCILGGVFCGVGILGGAGVCILVGVFSGVVAVLGGAGLLTFFDGLVDVLGLLKPDVFVSFFGFDFTW